MADQTSLPPYWKRWIRIGHSAFTLLLIITTLIALFQTAHSLLSNINICALAALTGSWYWFFVMKHPQWWRQPLPMLLYLSGMLVFWVGLIHLSVAYILVIYILYPHVFGLLPWRWSIPAGIVLTILTNWQLAQLAGQPIFASRTQLSISIATILFNTLLTLWIDSVLYQSGERQQLIHELQATRQELATAERQAGTLTERQRLARDIHDTLTQGFVSIVMHLEVAEQKQTAGDANFKQHTRFAATIARESLAEARCLVWALRPEALERSSLAKALERLTERWTLESGISASTTIDGLPKTLLPEIEVTLLRAGQEGLANVRKHAQAEHVMLTLTYMDDLVVLDIQDDGQGFLSDETRAVETEQQGGFGIQAMRARAEQLGGKVVIESTPGEGTTLMLQLPLFETVERTQEQAEWKNVSVSS